MLPDRVLMNSWNEFHEVACFPQVRATVKYAWLKNKWSGLLRKCWCSWGTHVWFTSLFYLVVSDLKKQSSRRRAVSRCAPLTKWKLLCQCVELVLSWLTLDVLKYRFIYRRNCSGWSEVMGCRQCICFPATASYKWFSLCSFTFSKLDLSGLHLTIVVHHSFAHTSAWFCDEHITLSIVCFSLQICV